ncbi:hypothetical protein GH714_017250 [Hevea brasiliensis]|uniref:Uncharacterized protein n=1 Tax=Hevea brasiliensis TaxID=3981 RepID=A0A6A6N4T8_HEVBR|nr:hypothetical protein GH714_017250 [Hevea brasiliensis]
MNGVGTQVIKLVKVEVYSYKDDSTVNSAIGVTAGCFPLEICPIEGKNFAVLELFLYLVDPLLARARTLDSMLGHFLLLALSCTVDSTSGILPCLPLVNSATQQAILVVGCFLQLVDRREIVVFVVKSLS